MPSGSAAVFTRNTSAVTLVVAPAVVVCPVETPVIVSPATMPTTGFASDFRLLGSTSGKFVCADALDASTKAAMAAIQRERVFMGGAFKRRWDGVSSAKRLTTSIQDGWMDGACARVVFAA